MRRIAAAAFFVLAAAFMCGCSAKEAVASDKQEYIVSSIGFDEQDDGMIKMILEAVVVNSDDFTSEKSSKLIIGKGETVLSAYSQIISKITQPLMFSHCGVIAIGSGLNSESVKEVHDFCYNKDEINLAAMFIYTPIAEVLLSCEPISSVAVGYDVMSMVEVISDENGIVLSNLFYQIESEKEKPLKMAYMPFIVSDGDDFGFQGLSVFKDGRYMDMLTLEKVQALSFVTDSVTSGNMIFDGREIKVESSKTTYEFDIAENLEITFDIRLKTDGDNEIIRKQIHNILDYAKQSGEDIFGLGNLVEYKSPDIWDTVKNDYSSYFEKAEFRVNIREQ